MASDKRGGLTRQGKLSETVWRTATALKVEAGNFFEDVVDGDFFAGVYIANGNVALTGTARVGRA